MLAQHSNTPYSRFGLGTLRSDVFGSYKIQGAMGAATATVNHINFANPASYTNLYSVSLDVGIDYDLIVLSGLDSVYKSGEGSLTHIALGLPLKKNKWGMSVGILPFSQVDYNFLLKNNDPAVGAFNELFSGNGFTYQFYYGNALRFKNLSIGLNAIYMFGRLEYEKSVTFPDSLNSINARNFNNLNLRDFAYNIGFQYDVPLIKQDIENQNKDKVILTLGLTGRGPIKLNAKVSELWETFRIDEVGGSTFLGVRDTVLLIDNQKAKVNLPYSISIGASLHNSPKRLIRKVEGVDWMVGVEFDYTAWQDFDSPFENERLKDSWRLTVGGRIIPELSSIKKKYLERIDYGLGFYFGQNELYLDNAQFKKYGITFGFGLPVGASRSYISMDIGSRSNGSDILFRETSYKISASFTLNDSNWFLPRKYD